MERKEMETQLFAAGWKSEPFDAFTDGKNSRGYSKDSPTDKEDCNLSRSLHIHFATGNYGFCLYDEATNHFISDKGTLDSTANTLPELLNSLEISSITETRNNWNPDGPEGEWVCPEE